MIIAIIAKMKPALSTIQVFDFLPSSILGHRSHQAVLLSLSGQAMARHELIEMIVVCIPTGHKCLG